MVALPQEPAILAGPPLHASSMDTSAIASLPKSPRKRQKISHTTTDLITQTNPKKKARRGGQKFRFLDSDLPFDVLLEIFKWLKPLELLNLSYTTKELRSILTAGYTESIWKNAYKNIQPNWFGKIKYPPECPASVDIRHYTSVLFGETCLFCACSNAEIVHLGALTRLCNQCARQYLITEKQWPRETSRPQQYCDIFALCSDAFALNTDIATLRNSFVLQQDFEIQELALQQCVDDEARTVYKALRLDKKKKKAQFQGTATGWFCSYMQEKNATVSLRVPWLRHKLAGYINDLGKWEDRLHVFPLIQRPIPLNEEGWDLIKYKTSRIFESYRQKSRENAMTTIFKKRMAHIDFILKKTLAEQPKPWICPSLSTFARTQCFSDIIQTIDENADDTLIMKAVVSLADRIPQILTTWRDDADKFLLDLLLGAETPVTTHVGEEIDRAPLELATTFFECHCCTEPISYPRILVHRCLRRSRKIPFNDDDDDAGYTDATDPKPAAKDANASVAAPLKEVYGVPTATDTSTWRKMSLWSSPTWSEARQFISVDQMATKSAEAIIQACGENSQSQTAKAMKELDVRVECKRCDPTKGKSGTAEPRSRLVMNWDTAILHDIATHPDDISQKGWSLVTSEADRALVAEYESKILRRGKSRSYERCRHCDVSVKNRSTAELHLQRKHKIKTDKLQEHIYISLDMPMSARRCLVKI